MELKYQTSLAEVKDALHCTESELTQAKESLKVAEQTALNIEARYPVVLLVFLTT
jgi:hypothetical protein